MDESEQSLISDDELVKMTRAGDSDAYGILWTRHYAEAVTYARTIWREEAEDIAADAFASIFRAIKNGGGPNENFRAYVYSSVRNMAHKRRRGLHGEIVGLVDASADEIGTSVEGEVFSKLDEERMNRVFYAMEPKQREVLWLTQVEDLPLKEVGERLGVTPGNAGVMAHRARHAFVKLWIQSYVKDSDATGEHQWALSHVGDYLSGNASDATKKRMSEHLEECPDCVAVIDDVDTVWRQLRTRIVPAVVGVPLAMFAESPGAEAAEIANPPAMPVAKGGPGPMIFRGGALILIGAIVLVLSVLSSMQVISEESTTGPVGPIAPSSAPATIPPQEPVVAPSPASSPTSKPTAAAPPAAPSVSTPKPNKPKPAQPKAKPTPAPAKELPAIVIQKVDAGPADVCYAVVSGTAQPGSRVTVANGRKPAITVTTNGSGEWRAGPLDGLAAGSVSVGARDPSGKQRGDSAVVKLAKAPTLSATPSGDKMSVIVKGIPGMAVDLYIGGKLVDTVTLNGDGSAQGTYGFTPSSDGKVMIGVGYRAGCESPVVTMVGRFG